MKLCPLAVRTGLRNFPGLVLHRSVMLMLGALAGLCGPVPSRALGASEFSPIPKRSEIAFTNPVILVSPNRLNFGIVPAGEWATNTFLVQNVGGGTLVGKAAVPAPFKIISGGAYTLRDADVQVVTVVYRARRRHAEKGTVTLSGGGGAKVALTGRPTRGPGG